MSLNDVALVLVGAAIGFFSGWGLEVLRENRERRRHLGLISRELRMLTVACDRLLDDYESYDPVGRLTKNHSFPWGGEPTLWLLNSLSKAYEEDRSRLMLPDTPQVANDLLEFAHFLAGVRDSLKLHLETRVVHPLPSPRVSKEQFAQLRDRARRLYRSLTGRSDGVADAGV